MENNDPMNPAGPSTDLVAEFDAHTGMVESAFIAKLRATLIVDPLSAMPWPTVKLRRDRKKCLTQMKNVFNSLFLKMETRAVLPKGSSGSAMAVISGVLQGSKWPNFDDKKFPVPAAYAKPDHFKTFRRYEIAGALQLLYQAYSRQGGGGIRDTWPPKIPN